MQGDLKYEKLRDNEIRLVRIVDDDHGIIACEIAAFPQKILPEYTALSYQWGDPARNIEIPANGKVLRITKSLELFLKEVCSRREASGERSGWPFGWFWIDAVCINQEDLVERGEQVRKMREIYEDAHTMVIWLGEADSGTSDAFDLLEEIAKLDCEDPRLMEGTVPGISCKLGDDESFVSMLYETLTYDIGQVLWSGYWNRVWIIQEASTPIGFSDTAGEGSIWVCCGGCTLPWSVFIAANKKLLSASWENDVEEHANLHRVANSDIATLDYIQDRRKAKIFQETLYTMLVRSRTSAATDARDKVYAIVGLAKERNELDLQPNYTLSVEEVYVKTAKTIMELSQSLDCLGSASLLTDHDVPSWTPDWTVQHNIVPQPFYLYDRLWSRDGSMKQSNLFNASKNLLQRLSFNNNGRRLLAYGFRFDTISTFSAPRSRAEADDSSENTWRDWIKTANPDLSLYLGRCTRYEAFKKVLRADIAEV